MRRVYSRGPDSAVMPYVVGFSKTVCNCGNRSEGNIVVIICFDNIDTDLEANDRMRACSLLLVGLGFR